MNANLVKQKWNKTHFTPIHWPPGWWYPWGL